MVKQKIRKNGSLKFSEGEGREKKGKEENEGEKQKKKKKTLLFDSIILNCLDF